MVTRISFLFLSYIRNLIIYHLYKAKLVIREFYPIKLVVGSMDKQVIPHAKPGKSGRLMFVIDQGKTGNARGMPASPRDLPVKYAYCMLG